MMAVDPLEFTNAPVPAGRLRDVILMSRGTGLDAFVNPLYKGLLVVSTFRLESNDTVID